MSIDPNDLLIFARVVDAGSFSRAAEQLALPKSTVSRRISALEELLGERLLLRTTRKLVLTEFGEGLIDHARLIVSETEAAASLAQHRQLAPTGRLRISMPGDFADLVLGELLAEFTVRYPEVVLDIDLSPRRVDLLAERFDLVIRMGPLPDDALLSARRLAVFPVGLWASPTYLARHGVPQQPGDLVGHAGLCLPAAGQQALPWVLQREGERWEGLPRVTALANSPQLLVQLARAGRGVVAAAEYFTASAVRDGALVRVLPAWSLPPVPCWAVFPGRKLMPTKTRVFLDALVAQFG